MPVSWGDSPKQTEDRMSDLHQYAKWFDICGYDFSLKSISGKWECTAFTQGNIELSYRSETTEEPVDALHSCYVKMRDLGVAPK
jgi:hypothetical protein